MEQVFYHGFDAPVAIYDRGFACLVYTGGKKDFKSIRQDLENSNLTALTPLALGKMLLRICENPRVFPKFYKAVTRRPILIASGEDVWTPERVVVTGNEPFNLGTPVPTENIGEYLEGLKELQRNQYLRAKYSKDGLEILARVAQITGNSEISACIYSPRILPSMVKDKPVTLAHGLTLSKERLYFDGAFQGFSNCCVFGELVAR